MIKDAQIFVPRELNAALGGVPKVIVFTTRDFLPDEQRELISSLSVKYPGWLARILGPRSRMGYEPAQEVLL